MAQRFAGPVMKMNTDKAFEYLKDQMVGRLIDKIIDKGSEYLKDHAIQAIYKGFGYLKDQVADKGSEYSKDEVADKSSAECFVGSVMKKIIHADEYLKDQFRWQTEKEELREKLQRLRDITLRIQAMTPACSQEQINHQNPEIDRLPWELSDAVEEALDLLDELEEFLKHKEQLIRNNEGKERSIRRYLVERYQKNRGLRKLLFELDRNLNRLEEEAQKFDIISADVAEYSDLFENKEQKMLHHRKRKRCVGDEDVDGDEEHGILTCKKKNVVVDRAENEPN